MQILHWCKVNILKIIVLMGTLSLAMAFAGNDLVNFVGVPLAGFSAWQDYSANGMGVGADNYLMGSLLEPAHTPMIFLILSGATMVFALATSRKARNSAIVPQRRPCRALKRASSARRAMVRRCLTPANLKAAEQSAREQFSALMRGLGYTTTLITFENH